MKTLQEHVTDTEANAALDALADVVEADLAYIATRMAYYRTTMAVVAEVAKGLGDPNEAEAAFYDQVQDVRTKLAETYSALEQVAEAIDANDEEDDEGGDGDE